MRGNDIFILKYIFDQKVYHFFLHVRADDLCTAAILSVPGLRTFRKTSRMLSYNTLFISEA